MGYECPVCGTEEADGEHLANHLAFTALVRGGDHEDWLDDHVPDWGDRDPDSLAPEVTPHATETETEPVTERHDHDVPAVDGFEGGDGAGGADHTGRPAVGDGSDLSGEAADVLADARALTEQMYEDDSEESPEAEGPTEPGESTDSESE